MSANMAAKTQVAYNLDNYFTYNVIVVNGLNKCKKNIVYHTS